jgi:hypothetical protein
MESFIGFYDEIGFLSASVRVVKQVDFTNILV